MTEHELSELLDLYVADELPDVLRAHAEAHIANNPDASRDAETLRGALTQLRAAPAERPDPWFVERLLDTLLRDHTAETPAPAFNHRAAT